MRPHTHTRQQCQLSSDHYLVLCGFRTNLGRIVYTLSGRPTLRSVDCLHAELKGPLWEFLLEAEGLEQKLRGVTGGPFCRTLLRTL